MDGEDFEGKVLPQETHLPHYYGDIVRRCFFFAGFVIMTATLIDRELFSFYLFIGLFGVVVFTILAGLTSPEKRAVMFAETFISTVMFLVFEYFAINAFMQYQDFFNPIFFLRETIAISFLIALYYGTKTMRYHHKIGRR